MKFLFSNNKIFSDTRFENGGHCPEGILIAAGPSINEKDELTQKWSVMDIAPTILYLMEQMIPSDMDGQVITEAIKPNLLKKRPPKIDPRQDKLEVKKAEAFSKEEEESIKKRLRALGYLD
jgi:hypothetical protein